jgi:hypothetical protein
MRHDSSSMMASEWYSQAIWGLDYEVGGDRRIIQLLKAWGR